MKLVIRGRRYGKTTEAVRWLLADPEHRAILTSNEQEAERLRSLPLLAKHKHRVISAGSDRPFRGQRVDYFFDNLDIWIQQQFGGSLAAASMGEVELL